MISLLIGLPFNQLSSVSSVSAGIENIGGVYVESEGVRWICAFGPLDVWATVVSGVTDASGAVDGLDEHAANANATAAPMIVPVSDLVMVMLFMIFLLLEKLYSVTGQDVQILTLFLNPDSVFSSLKNLTLFSTNFYNLRSVFFPVRVGVLYGVILD